MDWPTQENFARHDEKVSDEQLVQDLLDTEGEIKRLQWLDKNLNQVRAAFQDLGFTTSLATLQLLRLDVSIGERIMFCDCLRELQRLRAERAKAATPLELDTEGKFVLKLGSKMCEVSMDECSEGPSAAEADEMLGRQHYEQ